MSEFRHRNRSPLRRGLFAGVAVALAITLVSSWIGCGKKAPDSDDRTKQGSQLAARLAGEWVSEDDETATVFFTNGTNKLVYSYTEKVQLPRSRLDPPVYTGEMKKHSDTHEIASFGERSITIDYRTPEMRSAGYQVVTIEFEFSSDNDFIAIYKCKQEERPKVKGRFRRVVPRTPPSSNGEESDDSDLRGVFLGGWSKKQAGDDADCTLEFTENTATMAFKVKEARLQRELPSISPIVCNYKSEGNRVNITDPKGHQEWFIVDFLSGREMVLALDRKTDNRTSIPNDGMVETLSGRWTRTSRPAGRLPVSASITAAKLQAQRIEQKLKKTETQQRDIRKERDDIVAKLREMGESAEEVKGNPRARNLADSYATLTANDESLDSLLATIDTQLFKARSIVRQMELEQAGISDDDMKSLSRQLREAEARTDMAPRPITPLDADAALKAAFIGRKSSPREKR